jgi:tetratricopeptide (TPR) repeat protein
MDFAMQSTNPEQRLGWLRQALASAERLGPSAELSQTLSMLAGESIKEPEESVAYLKRALAVNRLVFGENSIQVAEVYGHLAFLYGVEKKEADKEATLKQQIAVLEKVPRAQGQLSTAEQNLGFLYDVQKRQPEAESAYLSSIRTAESMQPKNDDLVLAPVQRLALLYERSEKYDQAINYYTRAVAIERTSPVPNRLLVSDLQNLSDLLRKVNRTEEAQRYDEERKEVIDRSAKLLPGSPTK